jgi:hypothetical protein
MSSIWFFYWWVMILLLLAVHQARARRRRQMGPRVQVEPAEFLSIVEREKRLVIKTQKFFLRGITYVTRSGDYYYYTLARGVPLTLPAGIEVKEARNILL